MWGGDDWCEHEWGDADNPPTKLGMAGNTQGEYGDHVDPGKAGGYNQNQPERSAFCRRCGAWRGQLGLEPTPELYVAHLVDVMREVRRVLRKDGTLWLNLGDSYASIGRVPRKESPGVGAKQEMGRVERDVVWHAGDGSNFQWTLPGGQKPKDLVGIPWRVAFALQADGWWLRSDIIWCLSGGTWLYVRSQKGDMPMMLRDAARLDPATVQLWDGKRWAQVRGWSRSERKGTEIELTLRSGERIACTPTHKFPTERGLVAAGELAVGDVLLRVDLPEPEHTRDCAIDNDAAWFSGLYVAEGSRAGDTIQIAGHAKEEHRWNRVCAIAAKYGGTATRTIDGNKMDIRVYGKVLVAILDELVTGKTAKDKGFAPTVWRYSNSFIESLVEGYLSGDGHWESDNQRWRLGFTRNYNLERDLRTACARLGWHLILNLATVEYDGRRVPTFRGEIRRFRSGHHNQKHSAEIVTINRARCRYVYDVAVDGEPHLFALASGILTHNSKGNPMPESVTDRPTKAHEYVFLLTKSARYYYDAEAIKERASGEPHAPGNKTDNGRLSSSMGHLEEPERVWAANGTRNARSVWQINTTPYKGAHFATMPVKLAERCILAGTSAKGCCPKCGAPWKRIVSLGLTAHDGETASAYAEGSTANRLSRLRQAARERGSEYVNEQRTLGWEPTCDCDAGEPIPCVVLDPFGGAGTTALAAARLGRNYISIDLNAAYAGMAQERVDGVQVAMDVIG